MPAPFQTSSRFRKLFVAGVIGCWLLAICLVLFNGPVLSARCSKIKDGMSQNEVRQALGNPTSVGTSSCIGAGNQLVTRWVYEGWFTSYLVDFDYIGPGGLPVVFRTERHTEEWQPPSWWPWPRAKARADAYEVEGRVALNG